VFSPGSTKSGDSPRLIERMTVEEVREALKKTKTVILPVGCTEQHGYHLPTCTDTLNAIELAKRVSAQTQCLVAPVLPYSFSGGELPCTINISPHVVSLLVCEICQSLALQGFRNIVVLPGHGGSENTRALHDGADMFYRSRPDMPDLVIAVPEFWEMAPSCRKAFEAKDYHAGWFETSLMMVWDASLVRDKKRTDSPAVLKTLLDNPDAYLTSKRPVDHPSVEPQKRQNPKIRVGVMGDPSKADLDFGVKAVDEAVAALVDLVNRMNRAGRRRG